MPNASHPSIANGKICYLEIPSRDINESSSFYNTILNWQIGTRGDGSVTFHDGVEVSGTWTTNRYPSTETGILTYIMVDDIQATIKLITNNGGKIVQPVAINSPVITATFSDPTGNIFGLYQH